MKIVLISRIIYPLLSPRAFRTTELAREFARLGHDVTVYAVLGDTDYTDFMKETGVKIKPIQMCLATSNSDGKCRYNFFDKVLYHAFHYILEYPDIEFCWKVPNILKKEKGIDLLITVAYPHPIHWGAAFAKKCFRKELFPKIWVSDCGDPFMGDRVNRHPFYFKYIEEFWAEMTDYIAIPISEARSAYPANASDKIRIIPQGFNFEDIVLCDFSSNDIPHFAYAGSVYPGYRDPSCFLEYLTTLTKDFKFTVYTNNPQFYSRYQLALGDKLQVRKYVPRKELIYDLSKQDFLVNFSNPNSSQSPSKLIDYGLSKRPILNLTNNFDEKEEFEKCLIGDYSHAITKIEVEQYNIRNIANLFLEI